MTTPTKTFSPLRTQRGLSLLEVLVSIVVLAIGLLGLAGLQMTALKSGHSAYLRSQATILAYDFADRMRTNRAQVLSGTYDSANNADRAAWTNSVKSVLGTDATTALTRNGSRVQISITWNETRGEIRSAGATGSVTQTFSYNTEI